MNYQAAAPVQQTIVVTTTYQKTASQTENGAAPAVTVTSVLGAHYGDVDGNANTKPGIAVIHTSGNGAWQYSTNGTTWTVVGAVSPTQGLLLPAADSLRFVPTTNASGQANLYFVAWDGT